jgi:hypothetical protein
LIFEKFTRGNKHRDYGLPAGIYEIPRITFSDDGQAIILKIGTEKWYKNGFKHRGNNLPAVETFGGKNEWWVNGRLHRDDGPAVIGTDAIQWWTNGKFIAWKILNEK